MASQQHLVSKNKEKQTFIVLSKQLIKNTGLNLPTVTYSPETTNPQSTLLKRNWPSTVAQWERPLHLVSDTYWPPPEQECCVRSLGSCDWLKKVSHWELGLRDISSLFSLVPAGSLRREPSASCFCSHNWFLDSNLTLWDRKPRKPFCKLPWLRRWTTAAEPQYQVAYNW